jgi:tetratricopeptide (TPR) repeat protein
VALFLFFLAAPRQYWFRLGAGIAIAAVGALVGNYRMLPMIMEGQILNAWLWVGLGAAVVMAGQGILHFSLSLAGKIRVNRLAIAGLALAFLLVVASLAGLIWQNNQLVERILPAQILARIMDIDLEARSSMERIYWTTEAMEKLRESPIIGFGGGAWEATYRSHQDYFYNTTQVHNDWAQLWLEVGTIGLLFFVGVWLLMFYTGWQNYRRGSPPERLRQAAVLAAAAGIGAHSLIDFNFALASVPILIWALFGITRAQQEIHSPSEKVLPAKKFAGLWPAYMGAVAVTAVLLAVVPVLLLFGQNYAQRSIAELRRQNLNSAVAYMERASSFDWFNAGYLADLGQFYARQGNMEKALKTLERAVNMDPYNWQILGMKAEALFNRQESQRAVAYMERVRDLAPWISGAWENLAWTYALAGINALDDGDLDTARDLMEKAIAVPGEMERRAGNLGEIEKRIWGHWADFSKAPRVQLSAGIGSYFLGQWQEAKTRLEAAREHERTKGDALLWLGLLAEKQGQAEEANQLFLQAMEAGSPMAQNLEALRQLPTID